MACPYPTPISLLRLLAVLSSLCLSGTADTSTEHPSPLTPQPGSCSWTKYGYPMPTGFETCPLPITRKNRDFAPWSYPPYCVRSPSSSSATPPLTYCVYTAYTFRGRGFSLISTPEAAAALVGTGALDDTNVPPLLRDHPASSTAPSALRKTARPYTIRSLPGRGKGLVARRRLPKWDTALIGFPVLVARTDFLTSFGGDETDTSSPKKEEAERRRRSLEDRALSQLPERVQEAILSLAHSTNPTVSSWSGSKHQKSHAELLEDIFRTNIFSIDLLGESHFALQIEGSRVNHDCRPNTFWRFSPTTLAQEVIALHEINMGEEITHSYLPFGLPLAERRAAIQRWGFNCTCTLCTANTKVVFMSNVRRTRLAEIYQALDSGEEPVQGEAAGGEARPLTHEGIEKLVSEMLLLIHGEDLVPQLCEYYAVVSRAFLALGDVAEARHYAGLSEEYWIRYGTEDHENVDGVRELWAAIAAQEKEMAQTKRWAREART